MLPPISAPHWRPLRRQDAYNHPFLGLGNVHKNIIAARQCGGDTALKIEQIVEMGAQRSL